jgi:hypothetical protein
VEEMRAVVQAQEEEIAGLRARVAGAEAHQAEGQRRVKDLEAQLKLRAQELVSLDKVAADNARYVAPEPPGVGG